MIAAKTKSIKFIKRFQVCITCAFRFKSMELEANLFRLLIYDAKIFLLCQRKQELPPYVIVFNLTHKREATSIM